MSWSCTTAIHFDRCSYHCTFNNYCFVPSFAYSLFSFTFSVIIWFYCQFSNAILLQWYPNGYSMHDFYNNFHTIFSDIAEAAIPTPFGWESIWNSNAFSVHVQQKRDIFSEGNQICIIVFEHHGTKPIFYGLSQQ